MAKEYFSRYRIICCLIFITITVLLIPAKGDATQITMAWDPTDPEPEGYRLYHRLEGQDYDYDNCIWSGTEPVATIDDLEDDTGHYFVVRAFEGDVESSDSNEVYFYRDTKIDSDDDGITDVREALFGTSASNADSDGDGIQDGTEIGLTLQDIGPDTDRNLFIPDADPSTTTDPTDADSDHDGIMDGEEDADHDGMVDDGESDPNSVPVNPLVFLQILLLDE